MRACWAVVWVALSACGRFGFAPGAGEDGGASGALDGGAPGTDAGAGDATTAVANRAFVTSTTYQGDLGGAEGADAKCQARADAAGLDGTFVAIISTGTRDWTGLLAGSRGWVDLAGLPIADQPGDWLDGHMLNPLLVDEFGAVAASNGVFLGWSTSGYSCLDWTTADPAEYGGRANLTEAYNLHGVALCDWHDSLACAEIGHDVAVAPVAEAGRLAFVTAAPWLPGAGRGDADDACGDEATAAGLPGTYLAMLAQTGSPAAARFSTAGAPWRRVDGVRLTTTAAALFGATNFASWLSLDATGAPPSTFNTWNGDDTDSCLDWTSATATDHGLLGVPTTINPASFFGFVAQTCEQPRALICLQE